MNKTTLGLPPEIQDYLTANCFLPDQHLTELAKETSSLGQDISRMQIAPEQGAFINFLVRLLEPKFCVEVGTFTGYSAICIASALGSKASLLCCDVSVEWTQIAERYFELAKVKEKIRLEIAPALQTLEHLPPNPLIDFAFIDADKQNYLNYYEAILNRLSPKGIILVDNVLWGGAVADPSVQDESTKSIRELNDFVAKDTRVVSTMLPLADGILLISRAASEQ